MNEKNWYNEQAERDKKLLAFWEERLADAEKAVEVAERQIAYLGSLAVQHSLEKLGAEWGEQRDEDNIIRGEN